MVSEKDRQAAYKEVPESRDCAWNAVSAAMTARREELPPRVITPAMNALTGQVIAFTVRLQEDDKIISEGRAEMIEHCIIELQYRLSKLSDAIRAKTVVDEVLFPIPKEEE